jgi:putative glutamine amidotransferase
MQTPPLILISGSLDKKGTEFHDASISVSLNYPLALRAAGGIPFLVPCIPDRTWIAQCLQRCAGVLLTGGDDVNPAIYSAALPAQVRQTVEPVDPARDLFELMLIDEVFRQRKPLLAICRGHQLLNVALGGTLIADLPSQRPGSLNHRQMERKNEIVHEVELKDGSLLAKMTARRWLGVNSTHHQAVAKVAKPLCATAVSRDGVIEGLELAPDAGQLLPFLASVQFHPERLFRRHPEHLELFHGLIRVCQRRPAT